MCSGVDTVQLSILTPLPGTTFMERMQKQGRLLFENFPEDWAKYRLSHVVHRPEGVDTDTIYQGNNYIKNHIYSFPRNQLRMARSFIALRSLVNFYAVYRFNKAYRKGWKGSHYYAKYSTKF